MAKQEIIKNRRKILFIMLKIVFLLILSVMTSMILIYLQYGKLHSKGFISEQIKISSLVVFFIYLMLFFGIKKVSRYLFQFRWIVAGGILLFLVLGRYHGDSITIYDKFVQTGSGSEFIEPLFGVERGIRSDDWVVTTPSIISNEFSSEPYGMSNEILRGTPTDNAVAFANTTSIFSIGGSVFTFLFGKINMEYAFSFYWYAPIFLCFLSTIELSMIITNSKFLSILGAVLITFSSWFMWWRFPMVLTYAQMAIVLFYYLICNKSTFQRCLCALGFSIFFSNFVCYLYPAWQVPIGYIALVFVTWIIIKQWEKIKQWKSEWIMVALALILSFLFIGYYLHSAKDYIHAISNTIYPGDRRDYGSMGIQRMFYGFMAPLYGLNSVKNPTMVSIVTSFYPIPLILLLFHSIKEKKKDILIYGLGLLSILFTLYCTIGIPKAIGDILLLSRSTTSKLIEILSVLQVYILLIYLKEYSTRRKINKTYGWIIGIIYALFCAVLCSKKQSGYMSDLYMIFMLILFAAIVFVLLSNQKKIVTQIVFGGLILITVIQGIYVRPIVKGFDAIYSKPIAKKIEQLCNEDESARWLAVADNIMLSGFLVASGAKTINSVNIYPNLELWYQLDKQKKYTNVYNRYAHIYLELTEEDTSFDLIKSDVIKINLNYDDLLNIKATYIVSTSKLERENYRGISFEKIYDKNESYIYKIIYN